MVVPVIQRYLPFWSFFMNFSIYFTVDPSLNINILSSMILCPLMNRKTPSQGLRGVPRWARSSLKVFRIWMKMCKSFQFQLALILNHVKEYFLEMVLVLSFSMNWKLTLRVTQPQSYSFLRKCFRDQSQESFWGEEEDGIYWERLMV